MREGTVRVSWEVPWRLLPARRGGAGRLLVGLHGFGGTPGMLEPSLRSLRPDADNLLVRGTYPVKWEDGSRGYGWMVSGPGRHDAEGRRLSEGAVLEAMDAAAPEASSRVLLGFSQGAFLAVTLGLAHPGRFDGVLALGGWINPEVARELLKSDPRVPVVFVHGEEDDRVPIGKAEEAVRILEGGGVPVRLVRIRGGHRFSREMAAACRDALSDWWGA